LEAALACETQADHWPEKTGIGTSSSLPNGPGTYISRSYYKGSYLDRNRYIVNQLQRLIAVSTVNSAGQCIL
jgi:hypothetical protein